MLELGSEKITYIGLPVAHTSEEQALWTDYCPVDIKDVIFTCHSKIDGPAPLKHSP